MTKLNMQDLYQTNDKFKAYVDHWSVKHQTPVSDVLQYKITALVANQYLRKESSNEEIHIEIKARQDNGI